MRCPANLTSEHDPLGELVAYGETEMSDDVTATVQVIDEDGSPQPDVINGRLCVCKHCHLVYWEPE
jgi:hypothetical protein